MSGPFLVTCHPSSGWIHSFVYLFLPPSCTESLFYVWYDTKLEIKAKETRPSLQAHILAAKTSNQTFKVRPGNCDITKDTQLVWPEALAS